MTKKLVVNAREAGDVNAVVHTLKGRSTFSGIHGGITERVPCYPVLFVAKNDRSVVYIHHKSPK